MLGASCTESEHVLHQGWGRFLVGIECNSDEGRRWHRCNVAFSGPDPALSKLLEVTTLTQHCK